MTKRIHLDFDLCESNAVCMGIAPDVFEVDADGYLNLLTDVVTPGNEASVVDAISQCPRQAISMSDS